MRIDLVAQGPDLGRLRGAFGRGSAPFGAARFGLEPGREVKGTPREEEE